nr:MAG TPA: head to tail adaptor [Caudoviricetes sp.]
MASTVLNERLKQYLSAEQSILVAGQSYRIGNRTLTRADLSEIRKEINDLITAGATTDEAMHPRGHRTKQVIMRD